MSERLFNRDAGLQPVTLLKENMAHVFSCDFCKIRTPPDDYFLVSHSHIHTEIMKTYISCLNTLKRSLLTGALSGLRQLLATEGPLKMMKNAFYFTLKALFVLEILCLNFYFDFPVL